MRKLVVFDHVSLDGYFVDAHGDMSFAHADPEDAEWNAFVAGNASGGGGRLLFGRVTYEMMASFWPTPMAMETMPVVAEGMNNLQKVVFSRTLKEASWTNTRLVTDDLPGEVRRLKEEGEDMTILGSGSIVSQLTRHGLIDEYQLVVNPIVLGSGRTLFEGIEEKVRLKLTHTRTFGNGNVLLSYEPMA